MIALLQNKRQRRRDVLHGLTAGDYVRLIPREQPFADSIAWWWEVIAVSETGIDVLFWHEGHVLARRQDVAFSRVTAARNRA